MNEHKTTITFWSGLQSIGGNIAEVRYGKDRIIFDFGYVFYNSVYEGLDTVDRHESRVVDLIRLGAIPKIDGIYEKNDLVLAMYDVHLAPYEESQWNTAVFISHIHLDHMAAIDTIAKKIPVYMSQPSLELYKILQTIEEEKRRERTIHVCPYDTLVEIGEIKVTTYKTDHDAYGASSFLIETPDAKIVYSGDLRMHGNHPEWNEQWFKKVREKEVDLLLLEATSFKKNIQENNNSLKEKELPAFIAREITEQNGLVIMNFYHRNIERLHTFVETARACHRVPVLEPETAYIASKLLPDIPFLVLYKNDGAVWKKEIYEKYLPVTTNDINTNPAGYLLQNSYHNRYDLLEVNVTNSVYIHANGMPFGEYAVHFDTLLHFLHHLGMQYVPFHVSGHATIEDTRTIMDAIMPKLVVPWHTMHPELFQEFNKDVAIFLPQQKETYYYEDGHLVSMGN